MHQITNNTADKAVRFDGTDLEIRAQLIDNSVMIDVVKAGSCVHRLTIDDALGQMEHGWIADLFAREDRVALSDITREAEDYISKLNINQG